MGGKNLDPVTGWEVLYCPQCGYAVEECKRIKFSFCPICAKKGREVRLEERYVAHYPENKVLSPRVA